MLESVNQFGVSLMGATLWAVVWSLIKIVALLLPLMGCVAYLTLWERKGIGFTQLRPGPNRVGPFGLLTPIADAVKLIFKEIIRPTAANKPLFFLGPIMTIMPALAAWVVIPFGPEVALACESCHRGYLAEQVRSSSHDSCTGCHEPHGDREQPAVDCLRCHTYPREGHGWGVASPEEAASSRAETAARITHEGNCRSF